jgi:hypothetical protein
LHYNKIVHNNNGTTSKFHLDTSKGPALICWSIPDNTLTVQALNGTAELYKVDRLYTDGVENEFGWHCYNDAGDPAIIRISPVHQNISITVEEKNYA